MDNSVCGSSQFRSKHYQKDEACGYFGKTKKNIIHSFWDGRGLGDTAILHSSLCFLWVPSY